MKTDDMTTQEAIGELAPENVQPAEAPKPKKRGRKQLKENMYFGEEQEKAVVDYINATDKKTKDRIFNTILKPAFKIMVESIIRRYGLMPPDEEFDDTFNDTVSFLMTKISCFDPTTKYKAYSYCGTICKNYLLLKLTQYSKKIKRNVSYDNPEDPLQNTLSNDIGHSSTGSPEETDEFIDELTSCAVNKVDEMVDPEKESEYELSECDRKVGKAISYLLQNWEEVFEDMDGSNKFNKSSVILFIQEMTSLPSRDIKRSLKVYSQGYFDAKKELLKKL